MSDVVRKVGHCPNGRNVVGGGTVSLQEEILLLVTLGLFSNTIWDGALWPNGDIGRISARVEGTISLERILNALTDEDGEGV